MSDIEIKIKQSKEDVSRVKLYIECSQIDAGMVIGRISENNNVNIRIDSEGGSMLSMALIISELNKS